MWVPTRYRRTVNSAVVILGIFLAIAITAYLSWPVGTGFLSTPQPAHNSAAFQKHRWTLWASNRVVLRVTQRRPVRRRTPVPNAIPSMKRASSQSRPRMSCHVEHPTQPLSAALILQSKCTDCQDRHAQLVRYASTGGHADSRSISLTKMRAKDVHRIHVRIGPMCWLPYNFERSGPIPPTQLCTLSR